MVRRPRYDNHTLLGLYAFASVSGVECLVLLLTFLRGRYSVLCNVCHSLLGVVTSTAPVEVGLNLCSFSLGDHLDVVYEVEFISLSAIQKRFGGGWHTRLCSELSAGVWSIDFIS